MPVVSAQTPLIDGARNVGSPAVWGGAEARGCISQASTHLFRASTLKTKARLSSREFHFLIAQSNSCFIHSAPLYPPSDQYVAQGRPVADAG